MDIFYWIIILWNIIVFSLYGIDKAKARARRWRISEITLIVPAFVFASVGAMLGMLVFNHKTSRMKFRILIPLAFFINVACFIIILKTGRLF